MLRNVKNTGCPCFPNLCGYVKVNELLESLMGMLTPTFMTGQLPYKGTMSSVQFSGKSFSFKKVKPR